MSEDSGTGEKYPAVVLLHGLCRSPRAMKPMERALRNDGYRVLNLGYPARRFPVEALAQQVAAMIRERAGDTPVHIVTHSLGGIIVRQIQATEPLPNLRRVVMIAPPNAGSEVVDRLRHFAFFRWLNGPAGQQLGTGPDSLPKRLGPVRFELGVIAGDRFIDLHLAPFFSGPHDGKVSVAATRVDGLADFRQIHATHSFITSNREAIALTRRFLASGRF